MGLFDWFSGKKQAEEDPPITDDAGGSLDEETTNTLATFMLGVKTRDEQRVAEALSSNLTCHGCQHRFLMVEGWDMAGRTLHCPKCHKELIRIG